MASRLPSPEHDEWNSKCISVDVSSSSLVRIVIFGCGPKNGSREEKGLTAEQLEKDYLHTSALDIDIYGNASWDHLMKVCEKTSPEDREASYRGREPISSNHRLLFFLSRVQQRTRLLNKFTENDSKKVDRLMELYFKYLDDMVADMKIEDEKHDMVRHGEIINNDIEEEFYLRCLDTSLSMLQLICYIMVEISNAGIPQICQRVYQTLNIWLSFIKIIRYIIKENVEKIGDEKIPKFEENEQKQIVELLENF